MEDSHLDEAVLAAWVGLNSTLKDSQMTRDLTYNESIVMMLVYARYREDGIGKTSVQELLKATHFLKSLMNRTLNALCDAGYLTKQRQGRSLYVTLCPEKLPDFLEIHNRSLSLARRVIDLIGTEDAAHFVRICRKLSDFDFCI